MHKKAHIYEDACKSQGTCKGCLMKMGPKTVGRGSVGVSKLITVITNL